MKKPEATAEGRYKQFFGFEPTSSFKVEIPFPKAVACLGDALAVEYRSDKKLSPRDSSRRRRAYRHIIGRGVKIYTDPSGKCLYITGGKFRVTDWLRG